MTVANAFDLEIKKRRMADGQEHYIVLGGVVNQTMMTTKAGGFRFASGDRQTEKSGTFLLVTPTTIFTNTIIGTQIFKKMRMT